MKTVAAFVVASIVAGAGLLLWAQESPTIRVTTRLVQVDVIVRDKNRPVANLKKEDFTLLEKGKERQIASFSMTAVSTPPPAQAGMKMPPNIFSNRFDRTAAAPSTMTVILIDGMNTNLLDQVLVRKSALEVLQSLKPDDRVALYMFNTRLRVVHDFTNDFDELRAAIQRTKGEQSGQLVASDSLVAGSGSESLDGMLQEQNDQSAFIAISPAIATNR